MNKILIIYSHPDHQFGINAAILKNIICALEDTLTSYTLIDLYQDNFNPVLSYQELRSQYSDILVNKYRDLILSHNKMIFIFPGWNFSIPAILKGFIDRVLVVKDFSFRMRDDQSYEKGMLDHEMIMLVFTTGSGASKVNSNSKLECYPFPVIHALKFCGINNIISYCFTGAKKSNIEFDIESINKKSYELGVKFITSSILKSRDIICV